MAEFPEGLAYTSEHEWYRAEDGTIGVTDHAQRSLGDVVYVELPAVGAEVEAGRPFGTIESVKSVSDLFAPVRGTVVAANTALADQPELVNREPYGGGWLIRVEPAGDPAGLLDAAAYRRLVEGG